LPPGGLSEDGAPFEITLLHRNTRTGTPDDSNPILAADQTWYQPGNQSYHFNHGSSWNIPSLDTRLSTDPWYMATASQHVGDVYENVLYRDGHVSGKAPDVHAYYGFGGMYFFH
jgi:hypothetical protein